MAWTFINSSTGIGSACADGAITSIAANFLDADTLLVAVANSNNTTNDATITDSVGGNTWVKIAEKHNEPSGLWIRLYRASSVNVSGTMTITATSDSQCMSMVVLAFSGGHVTPDDQEQVNEADGVTTIAAGASAITPIEDNCLLVACLGHGQSSGSITADGGFSTPVTILSVASVAFGTSMSYLIQTSAASANTTFTLPGSDDPASILASFKAAADTGPAIILTGAGEV